MLRKVDLYSVGLLFLPHRFKGLRDVATSFISSDHNFGVVVCLLSSVTKPIFLKDFVVIFHEHDYFRHSQQKACKHLVALVSLSGIIDLLHEFGNHGNENQFRCERNHSPPGTIVRPPLTYT